MSDQTSTPMQLVEAGVAGADTGTTTGVGAAGTGTTTGVGAAGTGTTTGVGAGTDPLHVPRTFQTYVHSARPFTSWEWATPARTPPEGSGVH